MIAASYTVPSGHRLRLSLAQSYWPLAWLPKRQVDMKLHIGGGSEPNSPGYTPELTVPIFDGAEEDFLPASALGERNDVPAPHSIRLSEGSYRQYATIDTSSSHRSDTGKAQAPLNARSLRVLSAFRRNQVTF